MTAQRARSYWRHPLLALLVPACLLALGIWQLSRIDGAAAGYQARADRLAASIARLRPVAERNPDTPIEFTGSPVTYTAADALARMQDSQTTLHRDALVDEARAACAWFTVGCAVLATLAALAGLAGASAGALRGKRSRTALVSAFRGVVRMLPALLGCLALATALAVTGAVLFEIGGGWFLESIGTGDIKLALAGLCIAAGALMLAFGSVRQLRGALAGFTPQPLKVLGRAVAEADAPGLWAFLRDIAGRQGAGVPGNIVLGLTEGFFVTQSRVLISPEQRLLTGQTLYLPAAMLPLLSRGEVEAVIAHELAHFTGEDTQYTQHFLPLFASMNRSRDAVASAQGGRQGRESLFHPASILADHVATSFAHTVSHWSRLREFEADRAALRAGRGRDAATALIRSGIGAGLVGRTLDDVFGDPSHASGDFVGAVVERAGTLGFTDPSRHLEDRQPHPTDTHPPTRQRIEALGIQADDSLLAEASRPVQDTDAAFATSLFADWPGLRARLGADLLAVAHARDKRMTASLREAAAAVTEDVAVYENARLTTIVLAIPAMLMVVAGLFVLWVELVSGWTTPDDDTPLFPAVAAMFFAMAALLGWVAYRRHQRGRAGPFLVVSAAGFRCLGLAAPVPWSAVQGVRVTVGQAFTTSFQLVQGAPMPVQTGWRWVVRLDPAKRLLTLRGLVPRGMKPQAYLDLLNRALRAHRAQEALRRREAG